MPSATSAKDTPEEKSSSPCEAVSESSVVRTTTGMEPTGLEPVPLPVASEPARRDGSGGVAGPGGGESGPGSTGVRGQGPRRQLGVLGGDLRRPELPLGAAPAPDRVAHPEQGRAIPAGSRAVRRQARCGTLTRGAGWLAGSAIP